MNSGFITEMKDKNGDSWYHQIVVETQQQEIERLNNIINEIDFYIYEKMRTIYIRADGDIGKYSFKALEEVWHKVMQLKGSE